MLKIRIKHKKCTPLNVNISYLISRRNALYRNEYQESKDKVQDINHNISCLEAEDNRNNLEKKFKYFSDNPENVNMSQMWKLFEKIRPKVVQV